jgi:hypothetical protein
MIVHLNDGIIAAMPDDPVGGYNKQQVFTAAAEPPQCSVTSQRRQVGHLDCQYDACHVFHEPASPPLAYQRPVAVLLLRRHAERFYAARLASGRSLGSHIFSRHK